MSEEILKVSIQDKVATMTFNRPDKMNAINAELTRQAIEHLRVFRRDPDVGCIVLTGEGRAFCAGGDVSDMAKGADKAPTMEQTIDGLREGQEMCWLLHTMPKVTIAAVNGFAMGAGLGIAMSCDMRVASDKAKFGTAYAKVGFGGDYGTTWNLTHLLGAAKAKELFFTADIIDAAEAHRLGLVNRVVPHDELAKAAGALASQLAHGPLVSFRWMKENVNLATTSSFREVLDREALTHIRCGQTEDHKEGARSFVEKRPPVFQGR